MAERKGSEDQPQIAGLTRVLPYLYIGNAEAAQNKEELQRLKITDIINAQAGDVDNFFPDVS